MRQWTFLFRDRDEAGAALARALAGYRGADAVVYGLPRGGAVVATVVASALGLPLDLVFARKLGHPYRPEYAIGAVTDAGDLVLDEREAASLPADWLAHEKPAQIEAARCRRRTCLGGRAPLPVKGKIALVVDDGIATGNTIKAAVRAIRRLAPARIVVAAPVAPPDVMTRLAGVADEIVVLYTPVKFVTVNQFYREFPPVGDVEVLAALAARKAS